MRPDPSSASPRSRLALALLGAAIGGCARGRNEITPTTLGTDFTQSPRGKMIPFPWPGQSIAHKTPGIEGRTADPEAAMASGSVEGR